jgi:hypothetical protein
MSQATSASNVMQEFDTEFLLHAPELYIFSACRHIVELLLAEQAAVDSDEMNPSRFEERVRPLLTQLWNLAQATQRFDILVPLTPEAAFSSFFWRWFNWWNDYRQGLSAEDLDRVHRLQDVCDPGALEYRPPGDWLRYRASLPAGFKIGPLRGRKI